MDLVPVMLSWDVYLRCADLEAGLHVHSIG